MNLVLIVNCWNVRWWYPKYSTISERHCSMIDECRRAASTLWGLIANDAARFSWYFNEEGRHWCIGGLHQFVVQTVFECLPGIDILFRFISIASLYQNCFISSLTVNFSFIAANSASRHSTFQVESSTRTASSEWIWHGECERARNWLTKKFALTGTISYRLHIHIIQNT